MLLAVGAVLAVLAVLAVSYKHRETLVPLLQARLATLKGWPTGGGGMPSAEEEDDEEEPVKPRRQPVPKPKPKGKPKAKEMARVRTTDSDENEENPEAAEEQACAGVVGGARTLEGVAVNRGAPWRDRWSGHRSSVRFRTVSA